MQPDVSSLSRDMRLRLIQAACVLAWADAELADEEREFVLGLARAIELSDDDTERVRDWLKHGPPDLDPQTIPVEHRKVFMQVVSGVVAADGRVDPEESETLRLLLELLS